LLLKQKLYNLCCKDSTSIVDHLQNIDVLIGQLASIGEVISDFDLIMIAFKSLLLAWKVFIQMVIGWENLPTFLDLESMLLLEDNRRSPECDDDMKKKQ
jgi:hypothetical protein